MTDHTAPRPLRARLPRLGEWLALAGAGAAIAALTLRWYEAPQGALGAWDTFGPAVVLILFAAASGILLFLATLAERAPAVPVATAVWATVWGFVGVIAAIVRLLERPDGATGLCAGAWLAFGGTLLVLVGAWQSMRDERTHRYARAEPPARKPPMG